MRAAMTPTECMRCLASFPFPSIPVGLQLDTDTLLGACVAAHTDALAGTPQREEEHLCWWCEGFNVGMVNGGVRVCTELAGLALERNGAAGHSWETLGYMNVAAREKGILRGVRYERGHTRVSAANPPAAVYYSVLHLYTVVCKAAPGTLATRRRGGCN